MSLSATRWLFGQAGFEQYVTIGVALFGRTARARSTTSSSTSGTAPLGPGKPDDDPTPQERLRAFVDAYLDYLLAHLDLVRMSETGSPGARYRVGAYRFWHHHIRLMLADRDDPDADAHTLLAILAAEHVRAVTTELGHTRTRRAALALVDALAC